MKFIQDLVESDQDDELASPSATAKTAARKTQRRASYHKQKTVKVAMQMIGSGQLLTAEQEAAIIKTLKHGHGQKTLGALPALIDRVVEERTKHLTAAIQAAVALFPPGTSGRKQVVAAIGATLPNRPWLARILDCKASYVKNCELEASLCDTDLSTPVKGGKTIPDRCHSETSSTALSETFRPCQPLITNQHGRVGQTYASQIKGLEAQFLLVFVNVHASEKSHQHLKVKGQTLYTEMCMYMLYTRYRAEFLNLCLLEADMDSQYTSEIIPADVTTHQANCWHARWLANRPGFDLCEVYVQRLEECLKERAHNGSRITHRAGRPSMAKECAQLDPASWKVVPRSWRCICRFLKEQKITLLSKTDPKYCPLCENGVTLEARISKIREKASSKEDDFECLVLQTELKRLQKQLARYLRHLASMENQRDMIKQRESLTRNVNDKAVLYADFISWYARLGAKIRDLALVLIRNGRHLRIHNIHWGTDSDAGCDAYFVITVLTHVLSTLKCFDAFEELDLVTDKGPCFTSRRLWNFMSKIHDQSPKWRPNRSSGLKIRNMFLTENHGQSPADGTGHSAKSVYMRVSLENDATGLPHDGEEFVQVLNSDMYKKLNQKTSAQTIAFNYKTINYSDSVFVATDGPPSAGVDSNKAKGMRDTGEVKYEWQRDGVACRKEGVVCVRELTGQGPWQFVDTRHSGVSPDGEMCKNCTSVKSYPVFHGDSPCDYGSEIVVHMEELVQPSSAGHGDQSAAPGKKKKRGKKKKAGEDMIRVPELKAFLKRKGLSIRGRRSELLERAKSAGLGVDVDGVALGSGKKKRKRKRTGKCADDDEDDENEDINEDEDENDDEDEKEGEEEGEQEDDESGHEDDEDEDDVEFTIQDIVAWRTVGTKNPQQQFKVIWEGWPTCWQTEEELLAEPCKWKLAEPYNDKRVLRNKLTWVRSNTRHVQTKG